MSNLPKRLADGRLNLGRDSTSLAGPAAERERAAEGIASSAAPRALHDVLIHLGALDGADVALEVPRQHGEEVGQQPVEAAPIGHLGPNPSARLLAPRQKKADMIIQHFFDPATFTLTYVVHDPATSDAVVIDPVLDFDPAGARTSTASIERVAAYLRQAALRVHYVLETHAHADHLSGSQYLRREFGARVAIGERITEVQRAFAGALDLPPDVPLDGSQFDCLLRDGETLSVGSLAIQVMATPGHTPACVSYRVGDAVFTGDALFIEDYGTGRCDFPGGSAEALYESVHGRLYALPEATRVFVGHDYGPGGRPLRFETTIGTEKRDNVQLRASTSRDDFVGFRKARDASLDPPRLLFPSVQVNVDAGRLPRPRGNGRRYLELPLNFLREADEVGAPRAA